MKSITFGEGSYFLFRLEGNHLESSAGAVLAHQLRKRGCKLGSWGGKTTEILERLGHEPIECRRLFDNVPERLLLSAVLDELWHAGVGDPLFSGLCCTLPDLRANIEGKDRISTYDSINRATDPVGISMINVAVNGSRVVVTNEASINKLIRHLQGLRGVETSTVEPEAICFYQSDAARYLADRMGLEAGWRYSRATNAALAPT